MAPVVSISDRLAREARLVSAVDDRSVTSQIEHWATIGKCAEENPGLTYGMIKEIPLRIGELEEGESSEHKFG